MKLEVVCFQKLLFFLLIFQISECSGKIVSVEVFHEENFETKAGQEQDVVKLIDPELKSWEKDLMLDVMKYKASLQKNDVGDAKSRDSDESKQNHKLAKTEETFRTQEAIKTKENEDKDIGKEDIQNQDLNYQKDDRHHYQKEDSKILGEVKSVIKSEKAKHPNPHHRKVPRKHGHHHKKAKTWNNKENQIADSDLEQKVMDIEEEDKRIEDQLAPPVVLPEDEDTEGGPQIPRPLLRVKRQLDINAIADAHLENSSSSSGSNDTNVDVITADDRNEEARAKASQADLLKYLVGTLTSVAIFSFIAYCFIKDPKGCIHAFGLGCPCCIVCLPCIRKCQEKTDMEAVMKENMNRYMPGMVIHEDGSIEAYEVSPEEIDIVMEIVDIIKE